MPEKRIVTDPTEAANVRKRLVDPRKIRQIVLVTTDDQPAVQGYKTTSVLVISAWAATNKLCHAVLKELTEPALSVHIGKGAGIEGLITLASEFAVALLAERPSKARAYLQFKSVPSYPPERNGPREFCLLTICEDESAQPLEVNALEKEELLPEFDAAGNPLVEFDLKPGSEPATDEELRGILTRNEQMWGIWSTFGVTETTILPVDFQFHSTKKEPAERLKEKLEGMGLTVVMRTTRTLLIFKGWEMKATESAGWTLERLQARTRELYETAAKLGVTLEGTGAQMPSPPR